jgi:hypothetical protein
MSTLVHSCVGLRTEAVPEKPLSAILFSDPRQNTKERGQWDRCSAFDERFKCHGICKTLLQKIVVFGDHGMSALSAP